MSLIQTLPLEVIKLIAAGEVIDSLAAVVRELVENAIDAGANRIIISVFPELWQIQVADNGKGMSLEDLHQCASPHSTSKISHKNDLWRINSLGFRGEALHSIAQVAELEIISRQPEDDEIGWQVGYHQGKIIKTSPVAIASGTVVTVKDLFGRIPVRRQALPSLKTQTLAIQRLVGDIALAHPQITWQVWQDRKPWFNISPSCHAKDILPQLVKQIQPSDLHALEQNLNPPQTQTQTLTTANLQLTLGLPDRCHRRRHDWVKVAVNGRVVRSPALERIIIGGFAKTLQRDRFPVCFAHLNLCPTQIDWNRHPAKSEIYLHHLDWWGEQIGLGIEQALRFNQTSVATTVANRRVEKLIKAAESAGKYDVNASASDSDLFPLRAVAQVNKTYIVAEHPQGVWLVEQHIAHERVIYEQIQHNWQLIPLEVPIILNNLTTAQQEQLQRIGIELEAFGQQMWAVRTVPAQLQHRQDCGEAIAELSLADDLTSAQVAVACRSAIRNGTALELDWMQTLLEQWQQTKNPHTCPHGRPIYLSLEETSLSRFFRRHWVIGKSHGI